MGLGWDEMIPEDAQKRFRQWVGGFQCLRRWKVPRSYTGAPWRVVVTFQLQAFGDASQSAYGACVYLHVQLKSGIWKSSLVSRAKVAPIKRLSLPRLELMGASLCARLIVYVRQALKLPADVQCHCWTDSTVTLAWIQSDPPQVEALCGQSGIRNSENHRSMSVASLHR